MSTVLSVILIIQFIILLGIWTLTALYSLTTDINAEKRRATHEKREIEYRKAQEKREAEYHEMRMKNLKY